MNMGNPPLTDFLKTLNIHDDDTDRIIIGLDFGTTYSGIAYAFSTNPDQVYSVTEWPGADGRTVPKTPTVLQYSSAKEFKWGYELDRTVEEKIVGIKLLLDPDQKRPLFDSTGASNTQAELQKLGKPPVDVASDYIGAIYRHAMKVIEGKSNKNYLDLLDKQFVLSVPAVWSEKAKDTTLRAARNAGISPIELIKEPEAAALFTLHQVKDQGLQVGDAITICDAGGGTVDLVSYEIMNLQPLELKELAPPSGGIAGSMMINKRFEQWIKDSVGERAFLDLKETNGYRLAMKQFDEVIKPGFRSEKDEEQYISFPMASIPDNVAKGIKSNHITMTGRHLSGIFTPVIEEIDRLVGEQISKVQIKRMSQKHPKGDKIKAIFLVGGFGSSLYLKGSIAAAHPGIHIVQPNDAWSAIVRGAVLSKLPQEASVVTSVAEKHYGVTGMSHFDETRDRGQKKVWDEYDEIHRADVMSWYIHKNDDLQRDQKVDVPFYSQVPFSADDCDYQASYKLMMCGADLAPTHPNSSVTKVCTLTINFSKVPKSQYKSMTRASDGLQYQIVNYKLLVKIEGARMIFAFECGGVEYGSVDADY